MAEESPSSKTAREAPAHTIVYTNCTINAAVINNQCDQATSDVTDSKMNIGGSHVTEDRDSKPVEAALTPKAIKQKKTSSPELKTTSKMTTEQALSQRERFEDVFQDEIIKAFTNVTSFKKFARSKNGLCLNEHVIQPILEDHELDVEERKLKILFSWREIKGKKATVLNIRQLLQKFFRKDNPSDYIVLENGMFGVYKTVFLCEKSKVYLGVQTSEVACTQTRAIKFVPKNDKNLREAQILVKLGNHVNVVSVIHAGIHHADPYDYIYIVMEHSWTQTVRNMIEECIKVRNLFNEFIAWSLVEQLMRAVEFLHSHNIIHRDVKPDNVLASDDWRCFKLTDYCLSKDINDGFATNQTNANTGTEGYSSHETYDPNAKITTKIDVFSAGATIGEIMANGKHPFGEDPDLWKHNIKNNKNLNLSHLCVVNKDQVISLIKPMLEMDPEKRPTAKKVLTDVSRHFQTFQLKNPQTTTDESLATTSKATTKLSNTKKVLTGTTGDESLATTSKTMTELSITEKVNAIIMFSRLEMHLYSYKLTTQKWSRMQNLPDVGTDYFFSTVVSGKHIYILQHQKIYQLEFSDPAAEWKEMLSMKKYHSDQPSTAVLNGFIYVFGNRHTASRSVERYNAALNQWDDMCDMKIGREDVCVVATEDHIYCIGGQDEQRTQLESVARFDVRLNNWEDVESTPRSISHLGAAVAKNRIYFIDDKGVLCYDILDNSWSEIKLRIQGLFIKYPRLKILAVDEELYIIGDNGKSKNEFTIGNGNYAIYLLEPETKEMTLVKELKDKNIEPSACLAVKL